jgi:hypothetical protein
VLRGCSADERALAVLRGEVCKCREVFDENKVSSFRSPVRVRRNAAPRHRLQNRTDLLTLPLRERLIRRMESKIEVALGHCSYREASSRWVDVETTYTAEVSWSTQSSVLAIHTTTVWHPKKPWKGQSVKYSFIGSVQDVARRAHVGLLTISDKQDRRWLVKWASTPVACVDGVHRCAVQYSRQGRGFKTVAAWAVVAHDSNTGWYVERSYRSLISAREALDRHAARAAKAAAKRSHRR